MVVPMNRPDEPQPPLTHVVYHILLSLAREPLHGYGIIKEVEARTHGRLELEAGTLYGAIKRLRKDGWITEAPAPEGADRRRRYYALSDQGRAALRVESERLAELVDMARNARVLPGSARA